MQVNRCENLTFKSVNHPIKPFVLETKSGRLYFEEFGYKNILNNRKLKEIGSFFLDNFAYTSAHPFWKKCQRLAPTFDKEVFDGYVKGLTDEYSETFKLPDTTVLLGQNDKNELCAALYVQPLNLSQEIKNNNTLYIDSLAVNKKYRRNNVSKDLLNKVIESTKGRYEDSVLVAYNESVPFYLKQGYKIMEPEKLSENFIRSLKELRVDYPEYCVLMTKTLSLKG